MNDPISFENACLFLEATLKGDARHRILDRILKSRNLREALLRLRESMRSHNFNSAGAPLQDLERIVKTFDARTVHDGFHVLRDWDGKAEKLNEEIIPVDVLNFFMTSPREGPPDRAIAAIFLDYYLFYVLALFCLRSWDEGDAGGNLDRVTRLIHHLQGPAGSGHRFVANSETLLLVATSHFEPDEKAYERLLAKVKTLDPPHQVSIALSHAAILGGHLRHGFQDLYGKDLSLMRKDNGPDYPWLCFSVVTLMRAYSRVHAAGGRGTERERIVEGILNGLTADARAFLAGTAAPLADHEAEVAEIRTLFYQHREDLMLEIERHRPSGGPYSPLGFNFNFPHNVVKAMVIDALLESEGLTLTLNDLLTGIPLEESTGSAKQALAATLMRYARFIPDQVRDRATPVISYDLRAGLLSFAKTTTIIKEFATGVPQN